jgi:hypothetical protein
MDQEQLLNSFPPPAQTHTVQPIYDKKPIIPDRPLEQWYEHTQIGTSQIWLSAISAGVILLLVPFSGWLALIPFAIVIVQAAFHCTLTVTASEDTLRIRFGPLAWNRKSWAISEIASVSVVKLPWNTLFGRWGFTLSGKIYSTSGLDGVEIQMLNGKKFRIGSDEPEEVKRAIENCRVNT